MRAPIAFLVWALAAPSIAGGPNYDLFSDREGNIATVEQATALWTMLQAPGQLEAVFADAQRGNPRARRIYAELETSYFPDIGREVADLVNAPPCLVMLVRELSGRCVPNWSFLDFLSKDGPAGARLRKALFDGFAERARERHLENELVLSALSALVGVGVAAATLQEAGAAATVGRSGTKLKPAPAADGPHTTFKLDPKTGKVSSHAEWDAAGNPVKRVDVTGKGHGTVTGPHAHDFGPPNRDPKTGKTYPGNEVGVRPATPDELPR